MWNFRDQCDALGAVPAFDLFLAADGVANQSKLLVIDEAIDLVSLGEALDFACLVLCDSPVDVVGRTGVNASRLARHDVHEEAVFAGHRFLPVGAKADPSLRSG